MKFQTRKTNVNKEGELREPKEREQPKEGEIKLPPLDLPGKKKQKVAGKYKVREGWKDKEIQK